MENNKISNLNYVYNVEYYNVEKESALENHISNLNRNILVCKTESFKKYVNSYSFKVCDSEGKEEKEYKELRFWTSYPGLLVGSGNLHQAGDIKSEFSLGFTFDYVTGLPYIPGSSVKGVLRSAFKHKEYISEIISAFPSENLENIDIKELEYNIFGKPSESDVEERFKDCGFRNRDIFFDAILDDTSEKNLMAVDNITPHRQNKELLDLAEPNPIKFIKVAPGISFLFRFRLFDTKINDKIFTSENKRELFKNILLDFGVGAKTNVGYGVLVEEDLTKKSNNNNNQNDRNRNNNSNIGYREANALSHKGLAVLKDLFK